MVLPLKIMGFVKIMGNHGFCEKHGFCDRFMTIVNELPCEDPLFCIQNDGFCITNDELYPGAVRVQLLLHTIHSGATPSRFFPARLIYMPRD